METYIGIKIIKAEPQSCPSDRHKSKAGDPGYKIEYEDGYVSWSPKGVFDAAYRQMGHMSFGVAFEAMRKGYKVMRKSWKSWDHIPCSDMYLEMQVPDKHSKMTCPYLFITVPECKEGTRRLPWQPAQFDLFSEDWQIKE